MRTTGFADEGMRELYEPDSLAEALRDARRRTLALYAHLDDAALAFPYVETVNPPLWELSHLAWFQEFWCRRHRADDPAGERTPSILPNADARFNSAIAPHKQRWEIARLPRADVLRYMQDTLDATLETLPRAAPERRYFYLLSLLHEDMHGEAFLMTQQSLGLPAPALGALDPPAAAPAIARDVYFAGGVLQQGTPEDSPDFAFDNERRVHAVKVEPFSIAERTVTQGEFASFVEDDGYALESLWSPEGRHWRMATRAQAPRYWKRDGDKWLVRRFDRWMPLDASAPMIHVALHEAQAYCRWAGRRLPTESEWEFAARGGTDRRFPWGDEPAPDAAALDYRYSGPSAALEDPAHPNGRLRQMLGGVWEWTATAFGPYPGFVPGPYKEYSQPWFHDHQVLRGGCFATRSRLVHNRWRNFYQPHRNDAFAGFRTCALEA